MTAPHLRDHLPASLAALWPDLLLDTAVARRIVSRLVFEDGDDLDGVRGLSKAAARAVLERGRTTRLAVVDRRRSAVDPFVKYLFRAEDSRAFEAPRIPLERPGLRLSVSS